LPPSGREAWFVRTWLKSNAGEYLERCEERLLGTLERAEPEEMAEALAGLIDYAAGIVVERQRQ
jgi:hypothetical protein